MNTVELVAGRELDALVAEKVMGWTQTVYSSTGFTVTDGNGRGLGWWRFDQPRFGDAQPRYSTDIAAAWEVVRHINAQGLRVLLQQDWGGNWEARVFRKADCIADLLGWFAPDALPEAICLAALKAVTP